MNQLFKILRIAIILAIVGISATFALNNQDPVAVDLGPFAKTINLKLYVLVFFAFAAGSVLSALHFITDTLRYQLLIRKYKKTLSKARDESLESVDPTVISPSPGKNEPEFSSIELTKRKEA